MSRCSTVVSPWRTWRMPSPVNVPSAVASTPCRSHSCCSCNHADSVDGDDHALLGLAEPDLPRSQARVLQRRAGQVDVGADPLGHLADRRRQPAGSAIGDRREQAGGIAQHVDQQLLDDRVADLHAGTGDIAGGRVHRRAGERCAAQDRRVRCGRRARPPGRRGAARSAGECRRRCRCSRSTPAGWRCSRGRTAPRRRSVGRPILLP